MGTRIGFIMRFETFSDRMRPRECHQWIGRARIMFREVQLGFSKFGQKMFFIIVWHPSDTCSITYDGRRLFCKIRGSPRGLWSFSSTSAPFGIILDANICLASVFFRLVPFSRFISELIWGKLKNKWGGPPYLFSRDTFFLTFFKSVPDHPMSCLA